MKTFVIQNKKENEVRLSLEAAIRRLARKFANLIYRESRNALEAFLENVVRDSVTNTEHARRKNVLL